jgi:hypothetical protein
MGCKEYEEENEKEETDAEGSFHREINGRSGGGWRRRPAEGALSTCLEDKKTFDNHARKPIRTNLPG